MLKGIEIRIYPNEEQVAYISRLLGCCRYIYNQLVAEGRKYDKTNGEMWKPSAMYSFYMAHKRNTPFLSEVHSKVLSQSRLDYQQALHNYFTRKDSEEPRFHKRGKKDSCRFPIDAFIGIKGNRLSLIKQLKDIHFKCSRKDERYLNKNPDKVRSVTLRRTSSGKFFCSVLVEDVRIRPLAEVTQEVGIDLGIKDCAILSTGEKIENPHNLGKMEEMIKKAQRKVSRRQKGSKRKREAQRRVARLHEKVANRRKDFLHKATTRIVRENQSIYLEDLNIKGMMANHHLAKAVGDASMSMFVRMLEYKCAWYGRKLVKIDRFYPSSKKCHKCGYVNKGLTLAMREWECPECGTIHDRDINAAINILDEGRRVKVGLSSPEPNARGQGDGRAASQGAEVAVLDETRKKSA